MNGTSLKTVSGKAILIKTINHKKKAPIVSQTVEVSQPDSSFLKNKVRSPAWTSALTFIDSTSILGASPLFLVSPLHQAGIPQADSVNFPPPALPLAVSQVVPLAAAVSSAIVVV